MYEALFGSEMPLAARFFIAFVVVLGLIGLTAWLVRRFGADRLGATNARGRQPRLAVIDAASVDGRRRLLLIRRDNVEHLLMIGGPSDVVIEANIVRAGSVRDTVRDNRPAEASRGMPSTETSWPLQPSPEPAPLPPPAPSRTLRASIADEPWLPPEPGARARPPAPDSLTGMAAELSSRFNAPDFATPARDAEPPARTPEPVRAAEPPPRAPEPRAPERAQAQERAPEPPRPEPRMSAPAPMFRPEPAPAEPEPPQSGDNNLAEMAQRLEAALRRPPQGEGRPPVTDPLAAASQQQQPSQPKAPVPPRFPAFQSPKAPEPTMPRPPVREPKLRIDPRIEQNTPPKADVTKQIYDNLEQEMASLLGRPTNKP